MSLSPVAATRIIDAPAADIFELLARPARHAEFDGSGSVRGVQPGTPERLSKGAKFGMEMKVGLPYKILNEVVTFEEGRRIAWRHFGGHIWRWELEPSGPDQTRVTETFDPTPSKAPWLLRLVGARRLNRRAIEKTLDRLQRWAVTRG